MSMKSFSTHHRYQTKTWHKRSYLSLSSHYDEMSCYQIYLFFIFSYIKLIIIIPYGIVIKIWNITNINSDRGQFGSDISWKILFYVICGNNSVFINK